MNLMRFLGTSGQTRALASGFAFLSALAVASQAFAAEGETHAPSTMEIVFVLLNFAVFVFLIVKFGGPSIQAYYKNRRASIADAIEESRALRERAEQKLQEYSSKLDAFDREREQLLAEFRQFGAQEKERIIAEAEVQADRIREDAKIQAAQDARRARVALEGQLVDRAIDTATVEIQRRLNPLMQDRLIDRSIDQLKSLEQ